jgi:hypothetical protein
MKKKQRYNFTLDADLMEWFRYWCKQNRVSASSVLNQQIFRMYNDSNSNQNRPKMPSVSTKIN